MSGQCSAEDGPRFFGLIDNEHAAFGEHVGPHVYRPALRRQVASTLRGLIERDLPSRLILVQVGVPHSGRHPCPPSFPKVGSGSGEGRENTVATNSCQNENVLSISDAVQGVCDLWLQPSLLPLRVFWSANSAAHFS